MRCSKLLTSMWSIRFLKLPHFPSSHKEAANDEIKSDQREMAAAFYSRRGL